MPNPIRGNSDEFGHTSTSEEINILGSGRSLLDSSAEMSRAEPDVNRPGPVMKKEIIGLGLGLVVGFFFKKKPRSAKNCKGLKAFLKTYLQCRPLKGFGPFKSLIRI